MIRKDSVGIATVVAVLTLILGSVLVLPNASAQEITLRSDKAIYIPGDQLLVLGTVAPYDNIVVTVLNPNGALVGTSQQQSDAQGNYNMNVLRFPSSSSTAFPFGIYTVRATAAEAGTTAAIIVAFKPGISIATDKEVYTPDDLLIVSGETLPDDEVVITVLNPGGNLVATSQTTADGVGNYESAMIRFPSESATFPFGQYTVRATSATAGLTAGLEATFRQSAKPPPTQWVPASPVTLADQSGNPISSPGVGQIVTIESLIRNNDTISHTFTFIVQIKNSDGFVLDLSWIRGMTLDPEDSLTPGVSWMSEEAGEFTVEVFVWTSLDEAIPLSLSQSIPFIVT